jgi:HrpA-like RNA helicase
MHAESVVPTLQTKMEKLQAVRKTLPIYPYRQAILDAVDQHQIMIIGNIAIQKWVLSFGIYIVIV